MKASEIKKDGKGSLRARKDLAPDTACLRAAAGGQMTYSNGSAADPCDVFAKIVEAFRGASAAALLACELAGRDGVATCLEKGPRVLAEEVGASRVSEFLVARPSLLYVVGVRVACEPGHAGRRAVAGRGPVTSQGFSIHELNKVFEVLRDPWKAAALADEMVVRSGLTRRELSHRAGLGENTVSKMTCNPQQGTRLGTYVAAMHEATGQILENEGRRGGEE